MKFDRLISAAIALAHRSAPDGHGSGLPLQSRLEAVADATELDDVDETERQLLHVAATRARDRDRLPMSGVGPASDFLKDVR